MGLPRRRFHRLLLLVLGLTAALALVVAAAGLWLLPEAEPAVTRGEAMSPTDVERALQLARAHDPRRALSGVVRTLRLSQHEAELLLNLAAARVRPDSRWSLRLGAEHLHLQASLRLPSNPWGPWLNLRGQWLNLRVEARQTHGLPQLESVTVGRLPLPVVLVTSLVDVLAEHYGLVGARTLAAVAVQRVRLAPQRIDIVYAWGPDGPARVLTTLLSATEHERLRIHAARLADFTAQGPADKTWPLSELLPPMFELARQRSAGGEDPALENRAALLVLGAVANGVSLGTLLPERQGELASRPIRLTLAGRRDFPQHFLSSAALAVDSGGPMADMIGLFKELTDARSGSGFSFNDMAANRAGTRLGELAMTAPQRLQQRLSGGLHEGDFMPDVSDLPEFMSERDFRRRFGAPGSPAYQRMMRDIEDRLGATPLFR
jgi:hypothetical protein